MCFPLSFSGFTAKRTIVCFHIRSVPHLFLPHAQESQPLGIGAAPEGPKKRQISYRQNSCRLYRRFPDLLGGPNHIQSRSGVSPLSQGDPVLAFRSSVICAELFTQTDARSHFPYGTAFFVVAPIVPNGSRVVEPGEARQVLD